VLKQKVPAGLKQFVKKRLREPAAVEPSNPVYPRDFRKVSSLRKLLWWSTTREGLVELLRYADRNSMAHSREVRLPFLDHHLVEFVFKLPDRFLLRDGWTKWVLRKAFPDCVPPEISNRIDKLGYMPPQQRWLQGLIWEDVMVDQLSKLSNSKPAQPSQARELELVGRHV
jgi:asparagine synthase (glutamine-hydrolysing)